MLIIMNYTPRRLQLESILQSKSCFLFGPRQTGKSFLIRETLGQYAFYNLLDSTTFLTLSQNPKWIEQTLTPTTEIVIIDEIQKFPQLLDEVHLMIEKYGIRFLEVAALCNGQIINYTHISNDARVPQSTVQDYFQLLKDTLIAYEIPAWKKTIKRKPIQTSKFYFFDVGIARFLQHRQTLLPRSPEFGAAFEHYIAHELKTRVDLSGIGTLHYWRSTSGFEVDFIVNDTLAVGVKAKDSVSEQDLKGLRALREEGGLTDFVVVCLETQARVVDGIRILPWEIFLRQNPYDLGLISSTKTEEQL